MAAFQLNWLWIIGIAGIVSSIEIGFLYVGVFQHYWWQTPYTAAGVVAWCLAAKYAYGRLRKRLTTGFRVIALFYAGSVLYATSAFIAFAVFGLYRYRIGWFQDPGRDAIAISGGSSFLLSLVFALLVSFRVKWLWRAALLFALMGVDWLFLQSGVLIITGSWWVLHFLLHRLLMIGILEALDRFALNGQGRSSRRPVPSPREPPVD